MDILKEIKQTWDCSLKECGEIAKEIQVVAESNKKPPKPTLDRIEKEVCRYFNISPEKLRLNTRKRDVVTPRQIAMFCACNMTSVSLANIGSAFGGKDHSTSLHAKKTISNLIENDKKIKSQVEEIEKRICGK